MKIALYYRYIDPADLPAFDQLCAELQRADIQTVTLRDGDSVDGFDYLYSIGGDGTLLSSVQLATSRSESFPPILGINFGHLGFLTTAGKENIATLVGDLLAGRFTLEERTLLQLTTQSLGCSYALNEVFLHRPEGSSMLRTQVFVDDQYVATYAGDGVIVATPTGSTAYSLSCGGPILTPTSRCFVITPIAAHTLTLRPIIVPDTARLRLVTVTASHHVSATTADEKFTLGVDSHRVSLSLPQGPQASLSFELQRAPFTVNLIRMNTQNFFSAIRDKLMWGTEVRQ